MQVIDNPRARAFAEIQTDVETLCFCRSAQQRLRMHRQIPEPDNFVLAERGDVGRFTVRHRHQMTDRIRITVHHQEGILSPGDDKMLRVIARSSSRF